MNGNQMSGKVQTVLGPIDAEDLGVTMTHEHLLVDLSVWFVEPAAASEKALAYEPVSLDNLGWVRYHPFNNLDNGRLLDEELAISEAKRYKLAGGNSIVDVTNIGIGRDPLGLSRIARATGLNIIMGSGYYVEAARPAGMELTEGAMFEKIVDDITVGVDNTGVRAGIIGELGISWPTLDSDRMMLRAAASAQRHTGAPISVHCGRSPDSPFECIEVLSNAGADISRVIMCHVDCTIFNHNTRVKLAKTGCYLECTLNEILGAGGPFEVLVNNSKWSGLRPNDSQIPER